MTYRSIQLRYTWKVWNKEMSHFLIYQMEKGLSHTTIVSQYFQLNKCVNWKRIRTPHFLCNLRLAFSLFPFVKVLLRMDPAIPQAPEITIIVAWRTENTSRLRCFWSALQRRKAKRAWKIDLGFPHFCFKPSSLALIKPWIWSPCLPWKIQLT